MAAGAAWRTDALAGSVGRLLPRPFFCFSLFPGEPIMPQGDKSAYTDKQKRKAQHIEEGYEKRGLPDKEAERRGWATVNAMDHGGKKSGSGGGPEKKKSPAPNGG